MEKKASSAIILMTLLACMLTLAFNIQTVMAEAKTWYVDDSGGKDFTSIQAAINAASPGDTIYVYNGTYYEHVNIYKSLTLIGENKYGAIIDGSFSVYGPVVQIFYTSANFTRFTVQNASLAFPYYAPGSAIFIVDSQSCIISDNRVFSSYYGITSYESHDNTIIGTTISNTNHGVELGYSSYETIIGNTISDSEIGIHLDESHDNTIAGNNVLNSTSIDPYWGGGIYLYHSDNNTVAENTVLNSTEVGIWLMAYNNTITDNTISDTIQASIHIGDYSHENTITGNVMTNTGGVYLAWWSYGNKIVDNIISDGYAYGINVWGYNNEIAHNIITNMGYVGIQLNSPSEYPNQCTNNVVSENVISNSTFGINLIMAAFSNMIERNDVLSNNGLGILLGDSDDNTVRGNLVSNAYYGILLFSSDNTKVYHNNFIDNTQQVLLSDSFNTAWDNGYPSGGNYWSDFADVDLFSGPYQDTLGMDGIWDHPYTIDTINQDRYPLVKPLTLNPVEKTQYLIETVEELGLPKGTENSLIAKLVDAMHLLDIGNENGAVHKLMEFTSQVEALRGKKLTDGQADYLISEAQRIIELING